MNIRNLVRTIVAGVLIFFFFELYSYFSYWGVGAGMLLLVVVVLISFVIAFVSYVLSHTAKIYTVVRAVVVRISRTRLWRWVDSHVQKRFPRTHQLLKNTVDLTTAEGIALIAGTLITFLFVISFLKIALATLFDTHLAQADMPMIYFLRTVISPEANSFFLFFTNLGNLESVLVIFASVSLYLLLLRQYRWIAYSALSVGGGYMLSTLAKWFFHRPRPMDVNLILLPHDFSFPSGHAVIAVCLYGFIAFLLFRKARHYGLKIISLAAACGVILLVGLSRVYLGVHYPSDVFGGWYLGLAVLALVVTLFEVERKFHFPGLTAVKNFKYSRKTQTAYASVLVVGIIIFLFATFDPKEIIRPGEPTRSIASVSIFLQTFNKYSEDLIGDKNAPMSFIVVGSEDQLIRAFTNAGWLRADAPTASNVLRWYSSLAKNKEYSSAPMTPAFYNSRTNDLGFEKATAKETARQRHHTRYWRSGYQTQGVDIWVATASLDIGVGIGTDIRLPTHHIDPNIDTEREFIFNDLGATGHIASYSKVDLVGRVEGANAAGDHFVTDGNAYILYLK